MDPGLQVVLRRAARGEILEAGALLRHGAPAPQELRVVARFGDVVTCRVRADAVAAARADPAVVSLKATRPVEPAGSFAAPEGAPAPTRRGVAGASGRGVLVAALDWGCDFAHPSFRRPDGSSRLLAIWDQRGRGQADGELPNPYGYGRILGRDRIDAALRAADPYADLGYHPAGGPHGAGGKHGTHVLDIAAGTGSGVATEADLAFVHLASTTAPLADLGDSVRVLEALDFVRGVAGDRPWVANLSLGRTGGAHAGCSLVERAIDALLEEAPGRAVTQSAGNHGNKRLHAEGTVRPGGTADLGWEIPASDPTTNELEIWYSGRDRLRVEIAPPGGAPRVSVRLGEHEPILLGGREVGVAYHRAFDPLNGDHHVDLFLEPGAPAGCWTVRLTGEDVVDGRFHAWIERDSAIPSAQSRFVPGVDSPRSTVGTIATSRRALVVGAYDPRSPSREPAPFSGRGPARDGRQKPDLVAPGVAIRAARSTAGGEPAGSGGETTMSGTSMAAPHVAGTVALLFEKAPRKLNVAETRLLVLGTTDPAEGGDRMRTGNGILNTDAALAAVRTLLERRGTMNTELDRYMTEALGDIRDFDIIGRAGGALEAPLRPGDVIVRFRPGAPLISEVEDADLVDGESASADGIPAEAAGPGLYARTRTISRGSARSAPAYRRVLSSSGTVGARTVVARPRPAALARPLPTARPAPAQAAPEPVDPLATPSPLEPADPFGAAPFEPDPLAPAEPPAVAPEEPFAPAEPAEPALAAPGEPECQRSGTEPEQVNWWDAELSDEEMEESPAPAELEELLRYLRVSWATFAPHEGAYFSALTSHLRRAGVLAGTASVDRSTFRDAVRAFQTARGLAADGIPGEDVLWELQKDWAESRALQIVRVDADQVAGSGGYDHFYLRGDIAGRYAELRRAVRALGGVVTSAGAFRDLDAPVSTGRSPVSMHYSGLALDLATDCGMGDPGRDPYVVTHDGRLWRLWCRSENADEKQLDAVVWHGGAERIVPVRAKAFDFTEVAERSGFSRIGPGSSYPKKYMSAEWWHFQCEAALTPWVSQFGIELLSIDGVRQGRKGVRRYDEATLSGYASLWANRKRIFQRGRNGWF